MKAYLPVYRADGSLYSWQREGEASMDERKLIEDLLRERPEMDEFLRKALEEKLKPGPMLLDDEETVVIVGEWPSIINGSKMVRCELCKARCSMAPTTQEGLRNYTGKVQLLCMSCYQENRPEGAPELPQSLTKMLPKTKTLNISNKN